METALNIPAVIVVMAVTTYALRFLPLAGLSSFRLPRLVDIWLQNIVIAILSAILFQKLFLSQGHLLSSWDFRIVGAIVSMIVAWLTRNLLLTVISGITTLYVLTTIF